METARSSYQVMLSVSVILSNFSVFRAPTVRKNLKKSVNFKTSQKLQNFLKIFKKSKFLKILKSQEIFKITQKNWETAFELGICQHFLLFHLNNSPPL